MLAVALLKKGFQVQLFERDVTAIRGEGKYRGPIQVGSRDWHVLWHAVAARFGRSASTTTLTFCHSTSPHG